MIRLEEITIANFRSFKDKCNKVDDLKKINVMVGKNNVGKTNVLRAIYMFFHPESYDYTVDRNMVKQLTGGASQDPKITISFTDDELVKERICKYKIVCDINKKNTKQYYSIITKDDSISEKLDSHSKIKKYIEKKIKCVYLSTTDEDIDKQSEELLDDLILQYFQQHNKLIKDTVSSFEHAYTDLMKTFEDNIESIESELAEQFVGMSDMGIVPKLSIQKNQEITKFLLENIKFQLDDSYAQDIGTKGAGIQRASLIMLSIYLLNQIYGRTNKIILLDEPEAFLYPLLERKVKDRLDNSVQSGKMQIFMTSHSNIFLQEMNNPDYSFAFLSQQLEKKYYKRSKNEVDINKYSVIERMERHNKYEVLKNYGLLDDINDYEYIIVCEGETDCNYIKYMLREKEDIPQIRYGKFSDGVIPKNADLNYKYVGKGASACLPILVYLDTVSQVKRKVFVLLDGDEEGKTIYHKIIPEEYNNLEIKKYRLPDKKEIEDMVFDKETYVDLVLKTTPELKKYGQTFKTVIDNLSDSKSVIEQTEQFINGNSIPNVFINKIKSSISQINDDRIRSDWFLEQVDPFFYND